MEKTADLVQLKEQTTAAFEAYVQEAEAHMLPSLDGSEAFLWSDRGTERAQQVRTGKIMAELWAGKSPGRVPDGLIHDWVGAAWTPGTTVNETLTLVQDYDHHQQIYRPDVIGSKLLSHEGNDFKIHLRLLKKKIITVVLDTYHDVHYSPLGPTRWFCRSFTTSISEVEDAGKPNEKILSPGMGYGFLWRLDSFWRFEEREGGVYVEVRAISLTRDVPTGLGWIIEPIVLKLPRQSLINTLAATRRALAAKAASARCSKPPAPAP
jgi:hypothetical protein